MILLKLIQEKKENIVGLFNSIEEGREFVSKIPGYKIEKYDKHIYESLDYFFLEKYIEIEYKGNRVPISKYSFIKGPVIDVFWEKVPNLSSSNNGLIEGGTRVDAYYIDNKEVKEYI